MTRIMTVRSTSSASWTAFASCGSRSTRTKTGKWTAGSYLRCRPEAAEGRRFAVERWCRSAHGRFADAEGNVVRVEIATKRDGHVSRVEHYQGDQQVSAEEDTDGDGQFDKWETYGAGRLASVAFDSRRRGKPDRRLTYATDGGVKIEVDPTGTGSWTSASR